MKPLNSLSTAEFLTRCKEVLPAKKTASTLEDARHSLANISWMVSAMLVEADRRLREVNR